MNEHILYCTNFVWCGGDVLQERERGKLKGWSHEMAANDLKDEAWVCGIPLDVYLFFNSCFHTAN